MMIPMMLASTRRESCFTLCKIPVQAGVLERDRCLRGKQLQHCDAGRDEDTSGQVVLEIEHADEFRLIEQWQAENGTGLVLTKVWIRSKRGLGRGIVENDVFLRAQDIIQHRRWQLALGHDLVTQMHDHRIAAGEGFGRDPWRVPLHKKQQTSLSPGLLDRGARQRLDQLLQNNFARHDLRHLDDRREVQMLNRCPDRGRRAGNSLVLPEARMKLFELPHLTVGSPANIPVVGVAHIEIGDLLKATRSVGVCGEFIGERLILHEGIVARRVDCLLVETLGVKFAAFEIGNLRVDQCDAIIEVLGAIVRPDLELLLM